MKLHTIKQLKAEADRRFPGTTVYKVEPDTFGHGAYRVAIPQFKTFAFDTRQEMLEYMNYWFNK